MRRCTLPHYRTLHPFSLGGCDALLTLLLLSKKRLPHWVTATNQGSSAWERSPFCCQSAAQGSDVLLFHPCDSAAMKRTKTRRWNFSPSRQSPFLHRVVSNILLGSCCSGALLRVLVCGEWMCNLTYGDLAVDDDLLGKADFNRISL